MHYDTIILKAKHREKNEARAAPHELLSRETIT